MNAIEDRWCLISTTVEAVCHALLTQILWVAGHRLFVIVGQRWLRSLQTTYKNVDQYSHCSNSSSLLCRGVYTPRGHGALRPIWRNGFPPQCLL